MADPNELLKWAIEHRDPEAKIDPEQSKEFMRNLDPKWFKAIFRDSKDDIDRMKVIIEGIKDDETDAEMRVKLLGEINYHCELTHNANDLHTLGGLAPVIAHLVHEAADVRREAVAVLGTSLPNNPKFQGQVLELGALPTLIKLLAADDDIGVRRKALLSISGLVRHFAPGLKAFLDYDGGIEAVVTALRVDDLRLQRRAAFLVSHLASEGATGVQFRDTGAVASLLTCLNFARDIDLTEKALQALDAIATHADGGLEIVQSSNCEGHLSACEEWLSAEEEADPEFDTSSPRGSLSRIGELIRKRGGS